jgi:tetratricopeptide (TPR) repeat protein
MAPRRRSRRALEAELAGASTKAEEAQAHYALALFHDNNSREAEAIPHYRRALELGLPAKVASAAWAWLASSLWKTGSPGAALDALAQSRSHADDPKLLEFIGRLERRIRRLARGARSGAPKGD